MPENPYQPPNAELERVELSPEAFALRLLIAISGVVAGIALPYVAWLMLMWLGAWLFHN